MTIIIPVYNRENLIVKAIDSVLSQEIENINILVVDDGSTDKTVQVVEGYSDKRVKLVSQPNSGAPTARNRGIKLANSKFLALLDSDDFFLAGHLKRAIKSIDDLNVDGSYASIMVDRGEGLSFQKPPQGIGGNQNMSEYLLAGRGFVQTSTVVMKTEVAKDVLYLPELKGGQDTDFAIRLYAKGYKLVFIKEPGAVWLDLFDEKRISSNINFQNRIEWLNNHRNIITRKAFLADYGWYISKAMYIDGYRVRPAFYYFRALINFCYSPKLAIVVFCQIFFSPRFYRLLSDFLAKIGIKP